MKIEFYATAERNKNAISLDITLEEGQFVGERAASFLSPLETLNLLHRVAARMQEVAQEELANALGGAAESQEALQEAAQRVFSVTRRPHQ